MQSGAVQSGTPAAAILQLPPLKFVATGGATDCYREVSGPPGAPVVLLLHGIFATTTLNWLSAFTPLGKHFRVIAPDLSGHGSDAFARGSFTLDHRADDVAALISVLRLEPVIVVGYSMGGVVAQQLARRHGARIAGLVLSGVDWGSRRYGRLARLIFPVVTELTLRLVYCQAAVVRLPVLWMRRQGGARRDASRRAALGVAAAGLGGHDPRALGAAVRDITQLRSIDWLHEISVPTTVLVTQRDSLFPPAEQHRIGPGSGVRRRTCCGAAAEVRGRPGRSLPRTPLAYRACGALSRRKGVRRCSD